jgi:hypothetical protein
VRAAERWAYRSKGGFKLNTGVSDPIFSAADLMKYYTALTQANGGLAPTGKFARLFLVPGMNHCGGGKATDQFDSLATLQNWVEQGKAPDQILARGAAFPGRALLRVGRH